MVNIIDKNNMFISAVSHLLIITSITAIIHIGIECKAHI